jgi:hypothetical protein
MVDLFAWSFPLAHNIGEYMSYAPLRRHMHRSSDHQVASAAFSPRSSWRALTSTVIPCWPRFCWHLAWPTEGANKPQKAHRVL